MKRTATQITCPLHPDVPEAFIDPEDSSGRPIMMAPPDATSRILNALGYPVNAKMLRRWAREGFFPSCWTGKRLLIKIGDVIAFMEEGTGARSNDDEGFD